MGKAGPPGATKRSALGPALPRRPECSALANLKRRVRGTIFRRNSGASFHRHKPHAMTDADNESYRGRSLEHLGNRAWSEQQSRVLAKENPEAQVNKPFRPPECGSRSVGLNEKMRFSIDSVSHRSVLLLESSPLVQKKKTIIKLVQI